MSRADLIALVFVCVSTAHAQHAASHYELQPTYSSSIASEEPLNSATPDGTAAPVDAVRFASVAPAPAYTRPFSQFALGAKVGILGVGIQAAAPLSHRLNLSGGTNFFSYTDNLSSDGIHYTANLRLRSTEASLDWFPFANGFRVSPGALLYNGNQMTGSANVPAGQTFTLDNVDYRSSVTDPVTGTGSVKFNKAAPKLTFGFGNMLPRNGRHFSVPVELGFAYVGEPKLLLDLKGTACDPSGLYCRDVATNPQIQANVAGQQNKMQNDISPVRFFPIFSVGFASNF